LLLKVPPQGHAELGTLLIMVFYRSLLFLSFTVYQLTQPNKYNREFVKQQVRIGALSVYCTSPPLVSFVVEVVM
jgi:hypothetical protein